MGVAIERERESPFKGMKGGIQELYVLQQMSLKLKMGCFRC